MKILDELESELKTIDANDLNDISDAEDPNEDAEIIGIMNEEAKRAFSLSSKLIAKMETIQKEHADICPPTKEQKKQHDQLLSEIYILDKKIKILTLSMWAEIHQQFPQLATIAQINIYNGWKVGYTKI